MLTGIKVPRGTFPASYGFLLLLLFGRKGKFVHGLIFDMKKSLWNQVEEEEYVCICTVFGTEQNSTLHLD